MTAFKPFPWKNENEEKTTPLDRQELNAAEEAEAKWVEENAYFGTHKNEDASGNLAVGSKVASLTTGKESTGFGVRAMNSLTTGIDNTGVGYEALASATTTKYCTAVGAYALNAEKTGEDEFGPGLNTAVGFKALGGMTGVKGAHHTAIGAETAALLKEGRENVFIGPFSARVLTKASGVVCIGVGALEFYGGAEEIFQMTAVGTEACQALEGPSHGTTALGYATLKVCTKGEFNTAVGHAVLAHNTTGSFNTMAGYKTGQFILTGKENTCFGYEVLGNIEKSPEQNVLFGYQTFRSSEGNKNTAFGFEAGLENLTGNSNVFLGYKAGLKETGSNKLYISNTETTTPIIFGELPNAKLQFNATEMGFFKHAVAPQPTVNKGSTVDELNTALKGLGIIAGA